MGTIFAEDKEMRNAMESGGERTVEFVVDELVCDGLLRLLHYVQDQRLAFVCAVGADAEVHLDLRSALLVLLRDEEHRIRRNRSNAVKAAVRRRRRLLGSWGGLEQALALEYVVACGVDRADLEVEHAGEGLEHHRGEEDELPAAGLHLQPDHDLRRNVAAEPVGGVAPSHDVGGVFPADIHPVREQPRLPSPRETQR